MQASGAAALRLGLLAAARGTLIDPKEYPPERDVAGEEPRVGVFVCHCGINIGGVVDVPEVVEYARSLPDVVYAEDNLYTCSRTARRRSRKVDRGARLNRVVVASCTPRTHEPLFQDTLREAGLNPLPVRDGQHPRPVLLGPHERARQGHEKAKDLVRMAWPRPGCSSRWPSGRCR